MKTSQTIILYSILGVISLAFAYIIFAATKMSSYRPETEYQAVLMLVAVSMLVAAILFFVPVATGLVLLSNKK